jgi:hypothetical protein
MSEQRMRWAEALAIERLYGRDAPRWIAEQIATLALAGDAAGIERFRRIAACYELLLSASSERTVSR